MSQCEGFQGHMSAINNNATKMSNDKCKTVAVCRMLTLNNEILVAQTLHHASVLLFLLNWSIIQRSSEGLSDADFLCMQPVTII